MNDIIAEKLLTIEKEKNVRILYACESGSRAWGFASPDSDYDVRFIYARPADNYLSIEERKDVIELPVNEVLDISGWDIAVQHDTTELNNLFRKHINVQ